MNGWLLCIPFITTFVGWVISRLSIVYLLRPQQQLNMMVKKITAPENVQKIMPQAETHIDHFLRNKLPVSFPMIGMFIGDRTIQQLKEIFMKELEEIFPVIMKGYMDQLQSGEHTSLAPEKQPATSTTVSSNGLNSSISRQLRRIEWAGAALGFVTGALAVLLTGLINNG